MRTAPLTAAVAVSILALAFLPAAGAVDDRATRVCRDDLGPETCLVVLEPPQHLACIIVGGPVVCVPLEDCHRAAGRNVCYALFQPYCSLWLSAGFGGCFID